MAKKRTLKQTHTHKLTRSGTNSYAIIIPIEFIRRLNWRERQKLDITLEGDTLVIKDWEK